MSGSKGHSRPGALAVAFLLGLSFLTVFSPSATASTVVSLTKSDGATVCRAAPISGSWSGSTCTVSGQLTVPSTTTLDIAAGVTVQASTGTYGIENYGTINNYGVITAQGGVLIPTSDGGAGVENHGTIHNHGTISATGGDGSLVPGAGIDNNYATINNDGTMGGTGGYASDGPGGDGIDNFHGTLNNDGGVSGTGGAGVFGAGNGISNSGGINDYCGVTLSSNPALFGSSPTPITCYTVTFDQRDLPSGASWGVTVTWPFGTTDHSGSGKSIAVAGIAGAITYSYDSPVAYSGNTYGCSAGCTGSPNVGSAITVSASYSAVARAPPIPKSALPDTLDIATGGGTHVTGHKVGTLGRGEVIYNIPSINQTLLDEETAQGNFTLFPNAVAACSLTHDGHGLVRVSGFFASWWGTAGLNSTEFVFGYYESFTVPAAGWPSEPACS